MLSPHKTKIDCLFVNQRNENYSFKIIFQILYEKNQFLFFSSFIHSFSFRPYLKQIFSFSDEDWIIFCSNNARYVIIIFTTFLNDSVLLETKYHPNSFVCWKQDIIWLSNVYE